MFFRFLVENRAFDINLAQVSWIEWGRMPVEAVTRPRKIRIHLVAGKKMDVLLETADIERLEAALRAAKFSG